MAYKVGSLADLISGTQDATSSNRKVVYIPAKRKNLVMNPENRQNIHVVSSGEERSPEVSTSQCERKKRKLESPTSNANVIEDQTEHTFSTRVIRPKKRIPFDKEKEMRTVFVKNVPYSANSKDLKRKFEEYGKVECLRFRCAPREDPRIPKKVSVIKKEFHPERTNICAFVRFCDPKSVEKAVEANGTLFEGYRIFVDKALKEQEYDQKKAVFLGNLPFGVEENDIWNIFEPCGKISDIRIVRDKNTGLGKGFAFVNFESADAVELALSLQGVLLKEKEIRVFRATKKPNHQLRKHNHNIHTKGGQETGRGNDKGYKNKQWRDKNVQNKIKLEENQNKKIKNKQSSTESTKKGKNLQSQFQGQKTTEKKKKKKMNKNDLKKKKIAKILTTVVGKGKTILK